MSLQVMNSSTATVSSQKRASRSSPSPTRRRTRCRALAPSSSPPLSTNAYVVPTANDVLRGRGGKTNTHPGNQRLLNLVRPLERQYRTLKRGQKGRLSLQVVKQVEGWGSRFLYVQGTDSRGNNLYSEMDLESAVKLVEQKFRDDPKKRGRKIGIAKKGKKAIVTVAALEELEMEADEIELEPLDQAPVAELPITKRPHSIPTAVLEEETTAAPEVETTKPEPLDPIPVTEPPLAPVVERPRSANLEAAKMEYEPLDAAPVTEPPIAEPPQSVPLAELESTFHCISPSHSLEDDFELPFEEELHTDNLLVFGVNDIPDFASYDSNPWGNSLRLETDSFLIINDNEPWSNTDMFQVLFDVAYG